MGSSVDDETWERLVTTGTHAYVFFDHPRGKLREAVDALRASMPGGSGEGLAGEWAERGWSALSAAEFAGPFAAFAHLRAEGDLASLQDFVAALRERPGIGSDLAIAGPSYVSPSGVTMMTKAKKCAIVGLIKVWVRTGTAQGMLTTLHDELGDVFKGATIVYGPCDILLELGAEDLEPVLAAALGPLQALEDVVRTETALSDFRRYEA